MTTEPEFSLNLDMFNFLIATIREQDELEGNQFVRRYLKGPQRVWDDNVNKIRSLPELWSVSKIDDKFLQFLKNIVGWTNETQLLRITDNIDNAALRRLIAVSGALWKRRGPETEILNVLNLLTSARARIWNWFDFRWVLDETELGEEHQGRDPWIIDLPGDGDDEHRSNLRIVDDGTLDRTLVLRVLRLMRALGERFNVNYLSLLDLFDIDDDDVQWEPLPSGNVPVSNGLLKLLDTTIAETTTAIVPGLSTLSEYVLSARLRGKSTASGAEWGLLFYHTSASDHYAALVDTFAKTLTLRKLVSGTPTDITVLDLATALVDVLPDVFYTLRVTIVDEGSSNRILVFIDGAELISELDAAHTEGSVGVTHETSARIECDEIEVFALPVQSDTLDINESP